MGFYLRKAFRFGPLRLNLSRSGFGLSAGVKGARVGVGPRGGYVHAGREGIYYRAPLRRGGRPPAAATGSRSRDLQPVLPESDLLPELLAAHRRVRLLTTLCVGWALAGVLLAFRDDFYLLLLLATPFCIPLLRSARSRVEAPVRTDLPEAALAETLLEAIALLPIGEHPRGVMVESGAPDNLPGVFHFPGFTLRLLRSRFLLAGGTLLGARYEHCALTCRELDVLTAEPLHGLLGEPVPLHVRADGEADRRYRENPDLHLTRVPVLEINAAGFRMLLMLREPERLRRMLTGASERVGG